MTPVEIFARIEHKVRPYFYNLPPELSIRLFSFGRKAFISILSKDKPMKSVILPPKSSRRFWDIEFNCNIFNAAGMFKKGEGYYTVASQGAGAYLAGTTTAEYRNGNTKNNTTHPVATFLKSGIAVNWMGLPNEGHKIVASRLSCIERKQGCPIGASIGADPAQTGLASLSGVLDGFKLYSQANVDFIELNESCPNVVHEHSEELIDGIDKSLVERLEYISVNFLKKRKAFIPVIVKFSTDTNPEQVPALIHLLLTLGFDGVNFGNTSTNYSHHRKGLSENEQKTFEYFIKTFGGGVSGRTLKASSYALAAQAVYFAKSMNPQHEFHVIRTGGIETAEDIAESEKSGISLNQWFTAYWEQFSLHGHELYLNLLDKS